MNPVGRWKKLLTGFVLVVGQFMLLVIGSYLTQFRSISATSSESGVSPRGVAGLAQSLVGGGFLWPGLAMLCCGVAAALAVRVSRDAANRLYWLNLVAVMTMYLAAFMAMTLFVGLSLLPSMAKGVM